MTYRHVALSSKVAETCKDEAPDSEFRISAKNYFSEVCNSKIMSSVLLMWKKRK